MIQINEFQSKFQWYKLSRNGVQKHGGGLGDHLIRNEACCLQSATAKLFGAGTGGTRCSSLSLGKSGMEIGMALASLNH